MPRVLYDPRPTEEELMSYSERAYFDEEPVAHCAARDEWLRIERLRRVAIERAQRSRRSRSLR